MGRKKIQIETITDEKNRLVTFAKRKNGLFKKAYELSVLCGCEIALIVFTRSDRLHQYATTDIEHALQRRSTHPKANEFYSNADMLEMLQNRSSKRVTSNPHHSFPNGDKPDKHEYFVTNDDSECDSDEKGPVPSDPSFQIHEVHELAENRTHPDDETTYDLINHTISLPAQPSRPISLSVMTAVSASTQPRQCTLPSTDSFLSLSADQSETTLNSRLPTTGLSELRSTSSAVSKVADPCESVTVSRCSDSDPLKAFRFSAMPNVSSANSSTMGLGLAWIGHSSNVPWSVVLMPSRSVANHLDSCIPMVTDDQAVDFTSRSESTDPIGAHTASNSAVNESAPHIVQLAEHSTYTSGQRTQVESSVSEADERMTDVAVKVDDLCNAADTPSAHHAAKNSCTFKPRHYWPKVKRPLPLSRLVLPPPGSLHNQTLSSTVTPGTFLPTPEVINELKKLEQSSIDQPPNNQLPSSPFTLSPAGLPNPFGSFDPFLSIKSSCVSAHLSSIPLPQTPTTCSQFGTQLIEKRVDLNGSFDLQNVDGSVPLDSLVPHAAVIPKVPD